MPQRKTYQKTDLGGVQLGASTARWHLEHDHIDLSPHHRPIGRLLKIGTAEIPVVEDTRRMALLIVDMQNDFCSTGGWADQAGFATERCRSAIPGIQRALEWARKHDLWVVWIGWANREDLRNLGAPTLYQYKKSVAMQGIGESLGSHKALISATWGTEVVEELADLQQDNDVVVDKVRTSGFYGTHLEQILRTQGLNTLLFAGVNTDQCVTTTMEDACFRDYNVLLIEDATATSSPDFCKQAVLHNTRLCWGFVTDTKALFSARETTRMQPEPEAGVETPSGDTG
ncbi:isochorismatase [Aliidiomarina sedimenti]|uniref:Isochorismatase n=1 Tax=Aliidiomarina sedimenti TaxID=1933879 RepID=A0ABY0BZY5_9GAMM|nr:cysteine hydrolase [Aliidiomarina sedimenti]RUO30690.1 isochorismatase [Aliidiomarina sedimenti]